MTAVAAAGPPPARARWQRLPRGAVPLAGLALWLLATAGLRPLMLPDEGRYVGVAWAMLTGGDWLTPTLNGLPYFHKPPLMYWVTAAAMGVAGPHALAARAAPLLGAWLMGLATWLWCTGQGAATVQGRRPGVALALLATTPFFLLGGQFANHDMLVAGLIALAIVAARRAVAPPGTGAGAAPRGALAWVVAAWAAAAFAVLAKGLIGVVIPALVLLPWLLAQRRGREVLRLLHPAGVAVFLALAAPWFVAMQAAHPGFIDYFIVEQHFRRYTQVAFNNQHPAWFFAVVLPLLTLPSSLWLVAAGRRLARAGRPGGDALLAAWWLVVVVGFFSLPRSKLVGYVLPALPPLAWWLAAAVGEWPGRRVRALAAAGAAACALAVAAIAWTGPADHADLGAALAAGWQSGDRLALVGDPFFDLPLQARLTQPPTVMDDWAAERIDREDNWRKELRDAGRFDPARAHALLWPRADAGRLRCGGGRLWLALPQGTPLPDGLADAQRIAQGRRGALWRLDGGAAGAGAGSARLGACP